MGSIGKKQDIVKELSEKLEKAGAVVLVSAQGLTVEQDTEMRKSLRENDVDYKVYKNTLIKRAIAGTKYEPLTPYLEGSTAVSISYEDATAAARGLDQFVDKYDVLNFKAGVIDGVFYDENTIGKMAKIPSREVLLSRLLGSFKSPMASFARVINEIAKAQSGESAPAEAAE